jgi:hypothetical protein
MRVSERMTMIKQNPLTCIIILSAIVLLVSNCILSKGIQYTIDSYSYKDAWTTLLNGEIPTFRTPPYPIFIGIIGAIFGRYGDVAVVIIQSLIYLVSIKYFWFVGSRILSKRVILILATAVYAMEPGITRYTSFIMTECLGFCGVIFLVTLLIKLYDTERTRYAVGFCLLFICLIFLRPALLYMGVVAGCIALIWLYQKRMKPGMTVLGTVAVTVVLLGFYAHEVERLSGIPTVSTVSVINDVEVVHRETNCWDDSTYTAITSQPLYEQYVQVKEVKKSMGKEWYLLDVKRLIKAGNDPVLRGAWGIPGVKAIETSIFLQFKMLYFILLVISFALIFRYAKHREIHWLMTTLCLVSYGQIGVMILGSYTEWSRLFVPAAPSAILLYALCFDQIIKKGASSKKLAPN